MKLVFENDEMRISIAPDRQWSIEWKWPHRGPLSLPAAYEAALKSIVSSLHRTPFLSEASE